MAADQSALPNWFPLRWQLGALCGSSPLPWWSAGWYGGELETLLQELRRRPQMAALRSAIAPLQEALAAVTDSDQSRELWLVPVPGWRSKPNPVPQLLAETLIQRADGRARCQLKADLLERSRRVASQHRLNRRQRWRNQWLSFRALMPQGSGCADRCRVLLIDDVLTSGATAMAAQQALHSAGWAVAGVLCLARTPRSRA